MRIQKLLSYALFCAFLLGGCTPAPPVNDSREMLWKKFGHQSIDNVLLAWGAPQGETKLTDGSRLVTYRHDTQFDYGGGAGCEVSYLAHVPHFLVDTIAMKGDAYECHLLALGKTGTVRRDTFTPPPFYPYYYR